MSNFITLFIIGVIVYVGLKLLISPLLDNSVEIDPEKEKKLTDA